jgi:hypothetical protein
MKHVYVVAIAVVVLGLALGVLSIPSVLANDKEEGVKIFDRDSVVYGRTFSEWSAEWNQWSYSFPVANHPLFDNADCTAGQSGPVWFLGGMFKSSGGVFKTVRTCTVPYGKLLFFPVADFEDSALEERVIGNPDEAHQQIGTLRTVTSSVEGATDIYCKIDGKPVRNLWPRFSVQSTAFGFTIPDDNLLTAVYGTKFDAGTYFPAVDDGYYMMLSLAPGNHVLHFGASSWLDVTYNLAVTK